MERLFCINFGPYSLKELINRVIPNYIFDKTFHDVFIHGVDNIENAGKNEVTYLSNKSYYNASLQIKAAACFVTEDLKYLLPNHVFPILTNSPESVIIDVINLFYKDIDSNPSNQISSLAILDENIHLEDNITINPGVVVKTGCSIGKNSFIDSNSVIGSNVTIGRNVLIESNCSIKNCLIGDNVIIHSGVCIGQDGFGYSMASNKLKKIPHIGKVIIQNNVEVGSNSSIDRGSMNDTIVGDGTKIDNLVQIAHNVIIGENCIIAGQVGISGSVRIGNNVMIGGQVGIKQHRKIGDNVQIAAASGVTRSIPSNKRIAGNPAKDIEAHHIELKSISRLTRK
jgi:UDP-3-O-[3-hydroxymyristoyl] glucosamine N-acyltransferase